MALDRTTVPIPFLGGVDTKTDPYQVEPPKLLALNNGIYTTTGAIRKRNGFTALSKSILSGSSIIGAGVGLWTYKSELMSGDGTSVYSYASGPGKWGLPAGSYQPLGLSVRQVNETSNVQNNQDSAYHAASGLQAFCWQDNGHTATYYAIFDQATGQKIATGTLGPQGGGGGSGVLTNLKVLALGNQFVFLWADQPGSVLNGKIRYQTVQTSTPTSIGAATDLLTIANTTTSVYDATIINGQLYIAFYDNASKLTIQYYSTGLVYQGSTQFTEAPSVCIAIWADPSNNVYVAYYNTTSVKILETDVTLSSTIIAPRVLETIANVKRVTGITTPGQAQSTVAYEVSGSLGGGAYNYVKLCTNTSGGAGTPFVANRGMGLISKLFTTTTTSHMYFIGAYSTYAATTVVAAGADNVNPNNGRTLQPTYFIYDASIDSIIGKISPSNAGGVTTYNILTEANTIGSTVQVALLQAAAGVISTTISFNNPVFATEIGNTVHLPGASTWTYDGQAVVEQNFDLYPDNLSLTKTVGGGSLSAGQYSVVATYKWTDSQGQVHRSAPSVPATITVSANDRISASVSMLRATRKNLSANPVYIEFWRTTANGTVYYAWSTGTGNTILNDTTVDSYTFGPEGTSDSTLQGYAQLYTVSGELPNSAPPGFLASTTYRARMIGIPQEQPYSWWYSKQVLPASGATVATPVEFSQSFVNTMDQRGGPLTNVAALDDKLIFFKSSLIYYVVGDGPAVNGQGSDYTTPQMIASDVGCTAGTPVVLTPDGLMFQSAKGICLLTRGFQIEYVGQEVEAYNSATVTSAVLMANYNQVRFTMNSGVCLVYDYTLKDERGFGRWSVFTNHAAVGAALFNGLYCFLKSDGTVMQEAVGTFTDNGTGIQLSLTTAWLKMAKLQGFQRVYKALILGTYKSAHTLQVQVAYDFDQAVRQTDNITATSTPPYQYRINLARQKCEAVQFTIQDTSPTAEDMSLSAITLEVGVKGGPNRMAPTRSFG